MKIATSVMSAATPKGSTIKLFVTGGAGHTGAFFLRRFLDDDPANQAVCLVRPTTDRTFLADLDQTRLTYAVGIIEDVAATANQMKECGAVLHIAQQMLCPFVLRAALLANVTRVFFVTTTGVFSRFNELSDGYRKIEDEIRASPLTWTILRPSMIYGTARDLNMHKLLSILSRVPLFPVFGDGTGLMQPVYVEDLAQGLFLAIKNAEKSEQGEYNIVGRYPLTYNEIVREAAHAVGRTVSLVHLPAKPSLWGATLAERVLGPRSPMTAEQVLRLSEDKCFSWSAARALGYDPRSFREGILAEARDLRAEGSLPPMPVSNP